MSGGTLVSVRDLEKHYPVTEGFLNSAVGRVRAVDGISFDLAGGETFGIVGESGCGKTTAALSMLRLEEPTGGQVLFRGEDITGFEGARLKRFRRETGMIFQNPDSSFDPRMSVGDAVAEPLVVQGMDDRERRREIVADLFERVGLSPADAVRYPHEFSGGQKQRIALARALSVNPELIVADEPVSALDVSTKSEILALLDRLKEAFGLTVVVISHDLGVVREICDRVAVMYLGEFVEVGPTEDLFADPQHPYTRALLGSIPTPDPTDRGVDVELSGDVPDPESPPSGCRFHTRCPEVIAPEDLDLSQSVWRNVLDFRLQVRDGTLDPEALAELAAGERDVTGAVDGPEDVPADAMDAVVRREYGLPERLGDADADDALDSALARLATGDTDGARAALDEVFVTPCERETPRLAVQSPGHEAACLLLDRDD